MIRVMHLQINATGRDIVIGDLHGHYNEFFALLKQINFDPLVDRVFLTGDIVDRGPLSYECIQLLFEPWFYSVLGNHDRNLILMIQMVRDALMHAMSIMSIVESVRKMAKESRMGFAWFADWLESNEEWTECFVWLDKLKALPHIIVVGNDKNRFHVVHAELAIIGVDSNEKLDQLNGSTNARGEIAVTESRSLAREAIRSILQQKHLDNENKKLSPTFCGHNVTPFIFQHKQHIFIDTGCYLESQPWAGLSAVVMPGFERHFVPTNSRSKNNLKNVAGTIQENHRSLSGATYACH